MQYKVTKAGTLGMKNKPGNCFYFLCKVFVRRLLLRDRRLLRRLPGLLAHLPSGVRPVRTLQPTKTHCRHFLQRVGRASINIRPLRINNYNLHIGSLDYRPNNQQL